MVPAMVNLLYSFDTKFCKLATASIYSALKSKNPNTVYKIHCMVAPRTRGRMKIARLVRAAGCKLAWREIRARENPYRAIDFTRWSPVIFYRLFAHKIFPKVGRMIYLDSDTVVLEDLGNLYETDLGDHAIGGVPDYGAILEADKHICKLLESEIHGGLYVNSGVLLMDFAKMPDMLSAECELVYPDQDLINVALDGKIFKLPMRYNFIPEKNLPNSEETGKPAIYHYYSIKPYYSRNSKSYVFFEQLVEELGMRPRDFIRHEQKYSSKKTNARFVSMRGNKLKLFGITIMRG
ncbi:MAG: glycosyltransferase family 8 protein [Rickettsiales bacterium]|jgi:lipopolysaccharide biosynthesis glycosyltransferase|nr:glycosyltransferase family 8 protein [Rickettsiales bacterium]